MSETERFYTTEELARSLSISTFVFWQYRPIGQSVLEELARSGIKRIELLESREQFDMADARSMSFIGQACRSCGIEVAAYHTTRINFLDIATEADRREIVDRCKRQIDTMLELGGVVWSSHAKVADTTMIKCYSELARHIENTPANIAVENFIFEGTWAEDRMAFLDKIDHPQVGMVLDIGHVTSPDGINPMTVPGGPKRLLEMCGRRLCHLHLHGF